MFCYKCGCENSDNAKFCKNCGIPIRSTDSSIMINPTNEEIQSPQRKKTGIIIGGSIIAAGLLIMGGILLVKNIITGNADSDAYVTNQKDEEQSAYDNEDAGNNESAGNLAEDEELMEDAEAILQEINGIAVLPNDTIEGQLQQRIIDMNDAGSSKAAIDVYAENYSTGERNAEATWDRTVFYCLEGYETASGYIDKNGLYMIKKEMKNAVNSNILQYDIYYNPINGIANKIVSIEYLENGLEITEYYYDNNGKVNFIFQYGTDNYVSTFATPDKYGDRYLFNNDSMVTWRSITDSGTVNYVLGDAEVERMKNQFAQKTMEHYSSLDPGKRAEFDEREKKMLNAAYNTYNIVLSSDGTARIQGYAYDGNGLGIGQAEVELYATDFSTLIYSVMTDEKGMYTVYVPNQEYEYNIRINKEGMESAEIYLIVMSNEQIGAYQDSVYLFDETVNEATVQMTLGDAFEYAADGNGMMRLTDATVYFRRGINNRSGDIVLQSTADNSGYLTVTLLPGVYTIEVRASGHETMFYTVVANPVLNVNIYEFYATPILNEGEYAIVLTWGEYPSDLDSHLFTTAGTFGDHIWYGDQYDEFNSYLDVDDIDSYGPETITMYEFSSDKYYKYCVVDYTNCSAGNYKSTEMSYSNACVNVYSSDGLIATYNVPTGREGVVWEVFEIRNGHITPIQRYYGNVEDKTWWHDDK